MHIEDDFIVDGEQHLGAIVSCTQRLVHLDHGQLQHVGGGPLYRTVHGQSFGGTAQAIIPRKWVSTSLK